MKTIINVVLRASLGASALAACGGGAASAPAIDVSTSVDAGTLEVGDAGDVTSAEDAASGTSPEVALGVGKVPTTLAGLRVLYGDYATWPTRTIACSRPKDGPRRLRENHEAGVYVAETLAGDGNAVLVRETEVIFENGRTDGQLDFAVYTPEGDLTDRSTFASAGGAPVTSAAPYTCMACHTERGAFRYTVLLPEGTGAGCR